MAGGGGLGRESEMRAAAADCAAWSRIDAFGSESNRQEVPREGQK